MGMGNTSGRNSGTAQGRVFGTLAEHAGMRPSRCCGGAVTAHPVLAVTPMRILFADKIDTGRLGRLEAAGHECIVKPELTADDLPEHIEGIEVLVVRSTEVKRRVFKTADRLSMVLRAGAGTDTRT